MATNYVQEGATIAWTNAGTAVSSGDVVVIGAMLGVALVDIANGAAGSVAIEGVYTVDKLDAAVIAVGTFVSWDSSGSVFDDASMTGATGDVKTGATAMETKGATTSETIDIKLLGAPGVLS